jgi:hypothetical protein
LGEGGGLGRCAGVPIVALAVAWEVAARSGAFAPYMLPALSAVLERIWTDLIAGDLSHQHRHDALPRLTGSSSCRRRRRAWHGDLPQRLANGSSIPSSRSGSDAEDRLPAGGHARLEFTAYPRSP